MRLASGMALLILVTSCRERRAPSPDPSSTTEISTAVTGSKFITRRASFALADVSLTIEDVHMSTHFDEVLTRSHALLVVNGGFFGDSKEPLGLAVSHGRIASAFAPQMSGGVLWEKNGVAHLTGSEEYENTVPDFAIQCRPRLVVGSHVNIKSDDGRRASRTALCLAKGGTALDVVIALGDSADSGPTLFELATELASDGCEEALNLDGGPSTGWASVTDDASVFIPPRAPVRQVVVIAPR